MSQQRDMCLARADEARTGAEDAVLDNVRDRWLRAEAAWMEMADRLGRVEAARNEREGGGTTLIG